MNYTAGPTTAEMGLDCPACGHKFTPEKIHRIQTPESQTHSPARIEQQQHTTEINRVDRLREIAWLLEITSGP